MKDKPFRIALSFEEAVRRALDARPISDAELERTARAKRQAKATVKPKKAVRRRASGH